LAKKLISVRANIGRKTNMKGEKNPFTSCIKKVEKREEKKLN